MKQCIYQFGIVSGLSLFCLATTSPAPAQPVLPDGTTQTTLSGDCAGNCTITGETRGGNNLFHSFSRFNVDPGATVLFNSPADITNIFSRVTVIDSSNISNIQGMLGVSGSDANLFLMNPNGIIFGPNASLDLTGSFVATTADAIQFGELGSFSTSPAGENLSTLTVNPSALLFNQIEAQPIINQSIAPDPTSPTARDGLRAGDGGSLLLVGGDVTLDGGEITVLSGIIELAGLKGSGEVGLVFFGSVPSLDFTNTDASGVERADVRLINGAYVDANAGTGVTLDAGGIYITANSVSMESGSDLSTSVFEQENAGFVLINATESVSLVGSGTNIFSTVESGGIGKAGGIRIQAPSVSLKDGAQLQTLVRNGATGTAGLILIEAPDSVSLEGNGTAILSRIEAGALGNSGAVAGNLFGDDGDISAAIGIITGSLSLKDGASLDSGTLGVGNAGAVLVVAEESVSLENQSIVFSSVAPEAIGLGGAIVIRSQSLSISDGSALTTETNGVGNAGFIQLGVDEAVSIEGNNTDVTGILSTAVEGSIGGGGGIFIRAGSLSISDGADVSVSSAGTGAAGDIFIELSEDLRLDGSEITAQSTQAGGGNIDIIANDIRLRDGSLVSTSVFDGTGGGGDITFTGTDPTSSVLLALEDSDILATAQFGPGGNIQSEDTPVFIYDRFATAIVPSTFVDARGFRGNLRVDISASSQFGTSGVVDVPDINTIESSLSSLSGNFLSPDQVVAGSCLAQRNAEQGSFTVTGTGGLQRTPYDAIRGDYPVTEVQPIEENPEPDNQSPQSKLPTQDSSWKLGDPVQEAQGMMVTPDGRIIASTTPQQVAAANAEKLICHPD